jgi:ferritin
MLTQSLIDSLNKQVQLEMYSSNLYLAMSAWCAHKGLNGAAAFLKVHSKDELGHAYKLFDYINETGALAIIDDVKKPNIDLKTLKDVFLKTYEHEQFITSKIFELCNTALEVKDYSTFNFLQWYTAEQHEEEKLFKDILDKIDIIGIDGRGLFHIDKEIGGMLKSHSA